MTELQFLPENFIGHASRPVAESRSSRSRFKRTGQNGAEKNFLRPRSFEQGIGNPENSFRNAGSDPIVLVREETTCGCTRLEYDARPILPGDTLRMAVLFDTSGQRGWQFKVVRLYFSSGARPLRLYIDAEVE